MVMPRTHEMVREHRAAPTSRRCTPEEREAVRGALGRQEKTFRRIARESGIEVLRVRRACDELPEVVTTERHAWLRRHHRPETRLTP